MAQRTIARTAGPRRFARRFGRPIARGTVAALAAALTAALAPALVSAAPLPAGARAAATPLAHMATDQSNWLREINVYRSAAGLPPVSANAGWDAGLEHHLTYLIKTPRDLISGLYASLHTENPLSPYFTPDGASEGASSDLELGGIGTPLQAIQGWLRAPFHAIGMLRPQLTAVGLALSGGYAALDVIHGLDFGRPRAAQPVLFPGPGITTNLTSSVSESPNPLETCGWTGRAGLPLVVLLPHSPARGLAATLKGPRGTASSSRGSLCLVDEQTYRSSDSVYGPTGRQILQSDHAVLLIPRTQLGNGRYAVKVMQPGSGPIAWSFSVNSRAGSAHR